MYPIDHACKVRLPNFSFIFDNCQDCKVEVFLLDPKPCLLTFILLVNMKMANGNTS